jgi:hypothetical protein
MEYLAESAGGFGIERRGLAFPFLSEGAPHQLARPFSAGRNAMRF